MSLCELVRHDLYHTVLAYTLAIRQLTLWDAGYGANTIIGRQSEGSIIRGFVNQKWVPYSQQYLFNAIPDSNHNANPTNPNRYSKRNPNPTNPTNPTTLLTLLTLILDIGLSNPRIIEPSDYRYITANTPCVVTVYSPAFGGAHWMNDWKYIDFKTKSWLDANKSSR